MKQTKSEPTSCEESEKTPLLGLRHKVPMSSDYTKFCNDDGEHCDDNDDNWWNVISAVCCCDFWYHMLIFIVFPLAIYYYWADIQNYFYAWCYGELPKLATEEALGPKVKRLNNLGNTCFFNSMNQSVNQTVLLHQMLTDHLSKPHTYVLKPDKGEELAVQVVSTELTRLTKAAHDLYCIKIPAPRWHVAVPRELLRELSNRNERFGRRKEEDSHEALRCLLDGLRMEEIDKIKDQINAHFKDPSSQGDIDGEDKLKLKMYLREAAKQCLPVDTVFGGIQVSTTICRECYTPLQNEEKFFDISLPLPESLAETIGSKDNYKPPVINGHNEPHVKETSFDGKESPQGDKKAADDDIVHEKQVMSQDQTPNMPPDDQAAIPLRGAHRNSKSENDSDKEDTSNVDICQPRDVENEHEDGNKSDAAVDPVSQWQGEEHEYEQENNNAEISDVKNTQPDVNDDSETLPSEEGTSSKGKADQQDLSYINHLNDAENLPLEDKPNPDVALKKAELLKFLKSKDLLYQAPVKCEEGKDPQSLEGVLTEYTALDILDENNKFICKTCSKNGKSKMVKGDDDEDDGIALCPVSKQIAIHQLPPVLILHLKRFSIEPDGVYKDNQHIKFPFKLNIAPYCTIQCIKEMGDCNQEIWYGLYAVVVHEGKTLEHGHYFAYVRRRPPMQYSIVPNALTWKYNQAAADGGHWFYASDFTVRNCDQGFDEVKEQRAYMLFYEMLPKIDCDK